MVKKVQQTRQDYIDLCSIAFWTHIRKLNYERERLQANYDGVLDEL